MDRDVIKAQLREYIRKELLRDADYPLRDEEPLITGGMIDSFAIAQIGVFVETQFNLYLPDTELTVDNMDTLNQMVECISAAAKRAET